MTTWADVDAVFARHGGRRRYGVGSGRWYALRVPSTGFVHVEIALRSRWCFVGVSRVGRLDDATVTGRFAAQVWPAVYDAARARGRGRPPTLPGGGRVANAYPLRRGGLVPVLDRWIGAELAWAAGREPSGGVDTPHGINERTTSDA